MKTKLTVTTLIVSLVLSLLLPVSVSATTGFGSTVIPYYVNGQRFDVHGYRGDSAVILPAVRLVDIAYMLNGTSAQFDIATPPQGGGWDFWIKRGTPYTPTGAEMQPIPERMAVFGSEGLITSEAHGTRGFRENPYRSIVVGFDGGNYPAFSVTLPIVQDIDDIYFSVYELSYWLGFHVVDFNGWDNWNETLEIVTTPHGRPTPSRHINRNTFPIGSLQVIDYAYALRVRTGPGIDYDVLTFVHRDDEFEILDYNRRFVQINTASGKGWIFAGFLSRRFTPGAEDYTETYVPIPPKHVTEISDLNINLWTYYLRFLYDTDLHDLTYGYEGRYGIVRHEDYGAVFAIRTDTAIPNFELIKVGLGGGDTGLIYFYPGEVLRSFDLFTPECALVVVTHFGTMPRTAVTFVDDFGVRRYFTIQQCGRDGYVLLMEFPLDERNPF